MEPTDVQDVAGLDDGPAIDLSQAPTRAAPREEIRQPEHADYLAAIWIMASNDEQPLITYRGIAFRLGLAEKYARQLVASRPELFRLRAPQRRLADWKASMDDGKHWPSWLVVLPKKDRTAAIEALTPDDCFRSQFRAEDGAERSGLDVIEWGLKHLDRVRTTLVKHEEGVAKSWQMWLTIGLTVANIVIHLALKAAG